MPAQACLKCDQPLPVGTGRRGRPASYCSPACRRAAEYELRRIQRALEHVELLLRSVRMGFMQHLRENVPAMEAERDRLEARLRELLAAQRKRPPSGA